MDRNKKQESELKIEEIYPTLKFSYRKGNENYNIMYNRWVANDSLPSNYYSQPVTQPCSLVPPCINLEWQTSTFWNTHNSTVNEMKYTVPLAALLIRQRISLRLTHQFTSRRTGLCRRVGAEGISSYPWLHVMFAHRKPPSPFYLHSKAGI